MADEFRSGREVSRQFYTDVVRSILDERFPGLSHAAALLGRGSEVLGYDDELSQDHNWEPRVLIFVTESDHEQQGDRLQAVLDEEVPAEYAAHPTQHRVTTIKAYFAEQLGFDVSARISAGDWLTWSEARLIMISGGAVFHDEIGLREAIARFAYYPDDVWYYLMIAAWWRVHPEMNLVGRTGHVGDELGSALIGARLVRDLMQLCFLVERRYAPYDKWFGTAFSRLDCGPEMLPVLTNVLRAENWQQRETALQEAYARLADLHNNAGITAPVPTRIERLWDRPFGVLWGDFPAALRQQITDPEVLHLLEDFPAGGIDRPRDVLGIPRTRLLRLVQPPTP